MSSVHQDSMANGCELGEGQAAEDLLPLVYEELRRLAAHKLANEAPRQTLQTTALVHEAWLRLGGSHQAHWEGRTHFLAAAAEAMRHIPDHAGAGPSWSWVLFAEFPD